VVPGIRHATTATEATAMHGTTMTPTATPIRVMSLADIKQLRRDLFRAVSGSLRMGDLHERAKLHGLTPWKHGFVWPVTSALYAAYVLDVAAINGRNSQETRMALDLSEATRVDRAAKGIASDAIRAIGLIAQIDADEAADVCLGVADYIAKFRSEIIAAARREEYPAGFDPFDNMQVVASLQAN
jgi:hypothetical protein